MCLRRFLLVRLRVCLAFFILLLAPPLCNIPGKTKDDGEGVDELYGNNDFMEPEPGPALLNTFDIHEPFPPHVPVIVLIEFIPILWLLLIY